MSLYNDAEACVDEMLRGLTHAHPGLRRDAARRVVWHDEDEHTVAVISGGGSGHEPFAAGYVGRGMLTAAVVGSVFASPPSANITAAITRVAAHGRKRDVLVIIPNYTGDCLNFGLAVEKARGSGLNVRSWTLGEDCALEAHQQSRAGKRGMCGLVFVFKIIGAMSARGCQLDELHDEAALLTRSMATLGLGLSACLLPGVSKPLFYMESDTAQLGLGVHGEAGFATVKVGTTHEGVTLLLDKIAASLSLSAGDDVCVLVNNLGGSSQLEMWVFADDVAEELHRRGVVVLRLYVGPLMTSIDMRGFQVCVLKVPAEKRADWLACLDADTDAPGWPGRRYSGIRSAPVQDEINAFQELFEDARLETVDRVVEQCLRAAAEELLACQTRLNELDSACGDGDTGSTLARLAQAVLRQLPDLAASTPRNLLARLASLAEATMGGTSGALYSLMLTSAGAAMTGDYEADWAHAFKEGLRGLSTYSGAKLGDRTMLDALIPAMEELNVKPVGLSSLTRALSAAQSGCEATASMTARAGRASYVDAAHITDVDAGAFAVVAWLRPIHDTLSQSERS